METIRSIGHLRILLCVLCVAKTRNPAGIIVEDRDNVVLFVSGPARAAVESVVNVPDHHRGALFPDVEGTSIIIESRETTTNAGLSRSTVVHRV